MTNPTAPTITTAQLSRVYAAADYLTELDGQDRSLVLEMSQAMLNDLIEHGELRPLAEYIRHYCDVLDSPDQADAIAEGI